MLHYFKIIHVLCCKISHHTHIHTHTHQQPHYERSKENQLDATECFIAIIICSTCFGHSHAHHHELETILVLLPHMVCNAARMKGYNKC